MKMTKAWGKEIFNFIESIKDGDIVKWSSNNRFYYGIVGSIDNNTFIFWNDGTHTDVYDYLVMNAVTKCAGEVIFKNED